jgi:Putative Flp pilus-assembly TadE/G-like
LSSTTDSRRAPVSERRDSGQVLVIFAFGLVALLAVAALVFDVGQNLVERRMQQKSADAAALAGAKYLDRPGCKASSTLAGCPEAVQAARELAAMNGYTNGGDITVTVKIPPGPESKFAGLPAHIQVTIAKTRGSTFAGVLGLANQRVATLAVAANTNDISFNASMLALNPTECQSGKFGGNGTITTGGAIQVNSTCLGDAMHGSGANVVLRAPSCGVVGGYSGNSKSDVNCHYPVSPAQLPTTGAPPIPDPLAHLPGPNPTLVGAPAKTIVVSGTGTASHCPDGLPAATTTAGTQSNPQTCAIGAKSTVYRIFPGVYWGGIHITGNNSGITTIYMEPGVYYMAGGGFQVTGGSAKIITVDPGGTTPGGGILLYNSDDTFTCPTGGGCIGAISLTGSGAETALVDLRPYQYDPYHNLLIFQDRDASSQPAVTIAGEGRDLHMSGTVYAPKALVKITGNGDSVTAQVIADKWDVQGNGNLNVTYDANAFVKLRGIGLVQ